MRAGRLRERIKIEEATESQDDAGQPIRTWSTLVDRLPAEVRPVAGGEVVRGRQVAAETTCVFEIRFRTDITTDQRIVWAGRTFGIVRVHDPYGRRAEIWVEAKEA
jgi:SPP1 family predicted phage head-tail adaptor